MNIDFSNMTREDIENATPRMKRAYLKYMKQIAAESLISMFYNSLDSKIYSWERREIDTLPKTVKGIIPTFGKSAFQICLENLNNPEAKFKFTTILEETEDYIVIIPAGFRSKDTSNETVDSINPPCVRVGEESSLMSLVHVLVIPKQRIYNAVTLTKEHLPLVLKMKNAAIRAVKKLWQGDSNMKYSKDWMLSGKYAKNPTEFHRINTNDMYRHFNLKARYNESKIATTFHLNPNHSVGWLHMHGIALPFATTGLELHGHKNVNVDDYIKKFK